MTFDRVALIINPYATSVSKRTIGSLSARLRNLGAVKIFLTEQAGHGQTLAQAASQWADLVVACGGDGTANEVANGLVGSTTALAVLPGGSTSVFARSLGFDRRLNIATEQLLGSITIQQRPLAWLETSTGISRGFLFVAGVGLDATVVSRAEAHPLYKQRLQRGWFGLQVVRATLETSYRPRPLLITTDQERLLSVSAVIQHGSIYTYIGRQPLSLVAPDKDQLGLVSLRHLRARSALSLPTAIYSGNPLRMIDHTDVDIRCPQQVTVESTKPVLLEADGEPLGAVREVRFSLSPQSLAIVLPAARSAADNLL